MSIVLRICTSEDEPGYKNSIISSWEISDKRLQNYLRNKQIHMRMKCHLVMLTGWYFCALAYHSKSLVDLYLGCWILKHSCLPPVNELDLTTYNEIKENQNKSL